jgi:Putative heavy-metal-binding
MDGGTRWSAPDQAPNSVRRVTSPEVQADDNSQPWLSNLSVSEFTMLRAIGFEPVGMVVGASIFRFGSQTRGTGVRYRPRYGLTGSARVAHLGLRPQQASVRPPKHGIVGDYDVYYCQHIPDGHVPGVNYRDGDFELAVKTTFARAVERLREEARALGAHGVTAVRLEVSHPDALGTSAPTVELTMIGTAIRAPGAEDLAEPFTSHLSGQAFAKLFAGGWIPTDLVLGVGAIRSYMGCVGGPNDLWGREEFTQRTMAIQRSGEIASEHLASVASSDGTRVIGATPVGPFGTPHASDVLFQYALVGTAAIRYRAIEIDPPRFTVSMDAVGR